MENRPPILPIAVASTREAMVEALVTRDAERIQPPGRIILKWSLAVGAWALGITTVATAIIFRLSTGIPLWDIHDGANPEVLDAVKIGLTTAAGSGAAVALVVAFRRQKVLEEDREGQRTERRVLHERYQAATAQFGHENLTIRLAGVYALSSVADDWVELGNRGQTQVCIDVLCAYLRSSPAPTDDDMPQPDLEVRQTITRVIAQHLQPNANSSWERFDFDFTGAVFTGNHRFAGSAFRGGDVSFRDAQFRDGTVSFRDAKFNGGNVSFYDAKFNGGTVSFRDADLSDGTVSFSNAKFNAGHVSFRNADFSAGHVPFRDAKFNGGHVSFREANFKAGHVSFREANFNAGHVSFYEAKFRGGNVTFYDGKFSGGNVSFRDAKFSGGNTSFHDAKFNSGEMSFDKAYFTGGALSFYDAKFCGSTVSFREATVTGQLAVPDADGTLGLSSFYMARNSSAGHLSFNEAEFSAGHVSFDEAEFNAGIVTFNQAKFRGGTLSFREARFLAGPFGGPESHRGNVSFTMSKFSTGHVSFTPTTFDGGHVYFVEGEPADGGGVVDGPWLPAPASLPSKFPADIGPTGASASH